MMRIRQKTAKKTRTHKVLVACTVAAAVLLLCGAFAKYVNPESFWPMAFAGLLYPVMLVVNLFFLFYWIIKKRLIAIPVFICLLISLKSLPDYFSFSGLFSSPKVTDNNLRIITWNAHSFHSPNNYNHAFYKDALKIFNETRADIICIQEYNTFYNRAKLNLNDSIKAATGINYYYFKSFKHPFTGMAIFSRYPVLQKGYLRITKGNNINQCIYVDIKKDNRIVRVYNLHLRSAYLPYKKKGKPSKFSGVKGHLKKWKIVLKRLKKAFVLRSDQVDIITRHFKKSPYPYIICGDFNDTPASYAFEKISKGLTNTFEKEGHGWGKTYCGKYPGVQIDYILLHRDFEVLQYKTITRKLSDHYPVYADFRFGAETGGQLSAK